MIRATLAIVALLALSGCGPDLSTPTTVGRTTALLSGTVNPGETAYRGLTVSGLGNVDLTLVSMTSSEQPQRTFNVPVILALGVRSGETVEDEICTDFMKVTVSPAFTTQLTALVHPGNYCASVTDTGRLTEPVTFTIREVSP